MKKGKWSMEEDNLIKNHIEKYGIGRSWQALSNTLGLQRCGRSCRSRWLNYLRPGLKHGNFTPAEERIICEMYSKRGSCWSVITTQLPGRTDLAIKNYWHSTLKRRYPAERSATARRRHRPTGSTSSDATSPDLALVVHNEGTTTGSSGHASVHIPLLANSPLVQTQVQSPLAAACILGKEEPAEQGGVMRCVPLEKVPPPLPPPGDQTGEMDIICAPMSPIPLAFLEPDVPWITGFDEIGSYLWWFDNRWSTVARTVVYSKIIVCC